jgi:glutathione S-transferase
VGEKGIDDLDMELVSLIEGQQKSAVHRRRSPLGTLPVLELDDGFLTESTVIMSTSRSPRFLFTPARGQ